MSRKKKSCEACGEADQFNDVLCRKCAKDQAETEEFDPEPLHLWCTPRDPRSRVRWVKHWAHCQCGKGEEVDERTWVFSPPEMPMRSPLAGVWSSTKPSRGRILVSFALMIVTEEGKE